MLARRLTTILPAMPLAEALETTRLHRVAGLTGARTAVVTARPCRAPPQTITAVGTYRCRARCRGRTTGCSSWMNCRSSAATSWRSCDNRSRRVFYEYNLQSVLDLSAVADLAVRLLIARVQAKPSNELL
jgi:hypothetical protein